MDKIVLPELGEGIKDAQIVRWNFSEGQRVTPEDDLLELVTDKAVFNVPATATGTLVKIYYRQGQTVPVGAVLADVAS